MDGRTANGGNIIQEPAHSHHRVSGPFVTPSYLPQVNAQSVWGSATHFGDLRPSYSVSFSTSHSPAVTTLAPPPRSSDVRHQAAVTSAYSTNYPVADFLLPHSSSMPQQETQQKSTTPEPPKKPLSPYMQFSKSIWFQVKAANPTLSVCQIGATIGGMWRDLTEAEKQHHLEEFKQDKVRYDNELKRYMKSTGLRAKDLRAMAKTQPKSKNRNRNRSSSAAAVAAAANNSSQLAAQTAAFMGLPMTAGVPMGMLGAAAGAMSMLPAHFTQVWAGGQQYTGQPMVSLTPGGQLQLSAAAQSAQGLYANGYTLSADAGSVPAAATKQASAARDVIQVTSPLYRNCKSSGPVAIPII